MKDLLGACRQAALPAIWSAGVKLARDGAVTLERTKAGESLLRVRERGRPVAQQVVLYTQDCEWACDCDSRADPCSHVVAAIIAASQPATLTARSEACPRLRYILDSTEPKVLKLRVVLVEPDSTARPIEGPLSRLLTTMPPGFSLDPHDLELENIIRAGRGGRLVLGRARQTFEVLARAREVYLDDQPVVVSAEPLLPEASVTDAARDAFTLTIRAPQGLTVVAPGVGRIENVLQPLGATELAGMSFERLPIVEQFPPERVELLLTQALPQLEAHLPVTIATRRLPGLQRLASEPRVQFELTHDADGLSVLPLIVYGQPPLARLDGDRLVPLAGTLAKRAPGAERDLMDRLRGELNLVPGRRVTFVGAAAARFVEQLLAFQRRVEGICNLPVELPLLHAEVEFTEARLDARFTVPRGGEADVTQVLSAFRSGIGVVPLTDGSLARLPREWLERHGAWLEELWAMQNTRGALPACAAPAALDLLDALGKPVPDRFERLRQWCQDFSALPTAQLPVGFTGTLRPYQRAGVDWLSFLRDAGLGAILADEMGLGKTLQTLAVLKRRTLIICPRSLLFNWAREAARFRPDLSVAIYHGSQRELDPHADVTLTTYGVLRLDTQTLAQTKWDCLVFDEAQTLKNPDSQLARSAYRLSAEFKVALSGTPMENRLLDLWSLSELTNPGLLGSREAFEARYATPIGLGDTEAQARLARRVRPFLLRRLKRDVLAELPPRSEVVLTVELEMEEREVYDLLLVQARREVLDELGRSGSVMRALEALLRLRQSACHLGLLPGRTAQGSSKVTCLLERIEALVGEGHRAIVFSQWTRLLDLLEPSLNAQGTSFLRLDGNTRDRQAVVTAFQDEDGPPLLLATLKAGGTGLNLTRADHVFLLDPWWNPAVEDQAADRAHRIGQTRPVLVHRIIAKDTIDERLLLLQEHKRALMVGLFEGGTGTSSQLTREDLLALLE